MMEAMEAIKMMERMEMNGLPSRTSFSIKYEEKERKRGREKEEVRVEIYNMYM
jgi:hypothetical protein